MKSFPLLLSAVLMTLALAGCNLHKPGRVVSYGPYVAKNFHVGSGFAENGTRVWCDIEVNGKQFSLPDDWRRIYTCSDVAGMNDAYIKLQVYVHDEERPLRDFLLSVFDGAVRVEEISGVAMRNSAETRLVTNTVGGGITIHNPETGEKTSVDISGNFHDLSPQLSYVISFRPPTLESTMFELYLTDISTGEKETIEVSKDLYTPDLSLVEFTWDESDNLISPAN